MWVVGVAVLGGGGGGGPVSADDRGEEFMGGRRFDGFWRDDLVGVGAAAGLQVGVVGGDAAGEGDIELVAGGVGGEKRVGGAGASAGGADGESLAAGDGVCVAESHVPGIDIPVRENGFDVAVVGAVAEADVQGAVGVHCEDGPAVVVLDEVGAAEAEGAGVAFGDDDVAGRHGFAVGQLSLLPH